MTATAQPNPVAQQEAVGTVARAGRHDHAARRRAQRHGREKGCWVYIPAEMLERAGYGESESVPWYRCWAAPRGRVAFQLYRKG